MMTGEAHIRRFTDEADLEEAVSSLWPADPELPLEAYRLRRAQQSLLIEAGRILQLAFCFSEGAVERTEHKLDAAAMSRPSGGGGRDRIAIYMERRDDPAHLDAITIRGVNECRPNAAAPLFASTLYEALDDAFALTQQSGRNRGVDMLTLTLEESTTIAFLKRFIEQPFYPIAELMVGYVPFRGGFLRAKALGQWMRRIPGTTFEGAPLRTGLVLDTTAKAAPRDEVSTALFRTPIPIAEVFGSKQDLVLADGRSSFLLVRTDMKVHGVVIAPTPIDIEYMRRGLTPSLDDLLDVERLWIQSIDHHRLSIYGTLSSGSLIHVADIQNGALRLRDPKADFEAAVEAVEEVVDAEVRGSVRDFMHALLARTMAGRGGVVVIGQKPRRIDLRRRLDPGLHLDRVEGDWQSFLNPDGVALVSPALELTAVGCFIKTITAARSNGTGTRHAAAAKATEGRRNVALAMSDDKTLTVYKNGVRVTRLG
ncbi:MAG TPA: diadenylate cyclase [Polyangiaceae bacterium]|jgi:hypothetical protein|nr:diadenylate cyclase [Polyangiaceae bacterium]